MPPSDLIIMAAGATAWLIAIPPVVLAGRVTARSRLSTKVFMIVLGVGIAGITMPVMSYVLEFKTQSERVRGIALALGTAQVLDGLAHIFKPSFYASDPEESLASAGNIFLGAGLLGLLSAYV